MVENYSSLQLDKESSYDSFKSLIEDVLHDELFNDQYLWYLSGLNGSMSIHPDKVDRSKISHKSLSGMCGMFSEALLRSINKRPHTLNVNMAHGNDRGPEFISHIFLTTSDFAQEIIIDQTIGQFIPTHPHVFVGTREELLCVFRDSGITKPDEMFNKIYGSESVKYPSPFDL